MKPRLSVARGRRSASLSSLIVMEGPFLATCAHCGGREWHTHFATPGVPSPFAYQCHFCLYLTHVPAVFFQHIFRGPDPSERSR